jgi:hypothetical protein
MKILHVPAGIMIENPSAFIEKKMFLTKVSGKIERNFYAHSILSVIVTVFEVTTE